jgi:hypothetical protein
MRILDSGHLYALHHLEDAGEQLLRFVKRSGGPASYDAEYAGTTCQEVLRALINRLTFVDALLPAIENRQALEAARVCLWALEARAYRRRQQGDSRIHAQHDSAPPVPFSQEQIETYPPCSWCGHIFCDNDHKGEREQ